MLLDQNPRDPAFLLKCAQVACAGYLEPMQMDVLYTTPNPVSELGANVTFDGTTTVPSFLPTKPICFSVERKRSLDVECYAWVDADAEEVYFSFQGTASNVDVLTDLRCNWTDFCLPRLGRNFDVHAGYAAYFDAIESDMDSIIAQCKPKRILFTGHSLAGSMSELATLHFADRYANIQFYCVTFGTPRTGCKREYGTTLDMVCQHARLVAHKDPVPCVPLPGPYLHASGVLLAPGKLTDMRADSYMRYPRDLFVALWALLKKLFGKPVVGHELLASYIPMLMELAHCTSGS